MSINFAAIDKAGSVNLPVSAGDCQDPQSPVPPNDYTELIQRLFHSSSVVAIFNSGSGTGITGICEEIASELSRMGKRVVLVSVHVLLHSSLIALPDETAFIPGPVRNVWFWPSSVGRQIELFESRTPTAPEKWLDSLRRNFDLVLLDCPALETEPGGAAIGAMAEAAVLAVKAAHTPKHQILRDQRTLQLSGVKIAGYIMMNAK